MYPGIPTTIKTMGVNTTTIAYLRVLIIEIGQTIILMVVEAQGVYTPKDEWSNWFCFTLEVAPKLPFVREWSSTPIIRGFYRDRFPV